MLFLDACDDLAPLIRLIKFGIIPIIQIGVPILLILYGMFDLAKAVIASKEDEIKNATKLLTKRAIYAVAVFLVVTLVTVVFGLLSSTGDKNIENQSKSGIQCWNEIKKIKVDVRSISFFLCDFF